METAANTIQDIYELTPIQKGLLFHSLYAPEVGLYCMQKSYTVRGRLNVPAFERAVQHMTQRHPVLRTSFYWEEADKPLQVVRSHAMIPLEQEDWRGLDALEQQVRLAEFIKRDRERGFDFSEPPLLRIAIIRMGDLLYEIIQSEHHIILDGWSSALFIGETIQLYQALCKGLDNPLEPSIPFKTYLSWLRKQELSKAEAYWQQTLQHLVAPTSLAALENPSLPDTTEKYEEQKIVLSEAATTALQSFARRHQLTINTLFQGTWVLLLSRYSGEEKVVYGCCVSGRPVELRGVESMVGVFINTLPICTNVNPDRELLPWLKQLQAQQVEMRQYEYSPLVEVQKWSPLSRGTPLFESIMVFENYPLPPIARREEDDGELQDGDLKLQKVTGFYKTNYPLTIVGYPGAELGLEISYDCRRFDDITIAEILNHFDRILQGMVANPDARLKDLSLLAPAEQKLARLLERDATFDFTLC